MKFLLTVLGLSALAAAVPGNPKMAMNPPSNNTNEQAPSCGANPAMSPPSNNNNNTIDNGNPAEDQQEGGNGNGIGIGNGIGNGNGNGNGNGTGTGTGSGGDGGGAAPAPACVVTDFKKVKSTKKTCTDIVLDSVVVPAGKTLDLTGLKDGTRVTFAGTTTFGFKKWKGPLVSVGGDGVSVVGAPGHVIDCQGERWWDGKGVKAGKKVQKPRFFKIQINNGSVSGLSVKNTPAHGFSINGASNLMVQDILFDNRAGNSGGAKNTDGFNVGESTDVTISGAEVYNQDDCLAINSGTRIIFQNGYCSGSHGLSIGSVGGRDTNIVRDVIIRDSTVAKSTNGIRIKAVAKETGSVAGVTFENIVLKDIKKQGIVFQQDYKDGKPTGKPTDGVPITGVTVTNVTGTVDKKGTNVLILCAESACSDWAWSGVSITGGKTSKKCKNIPSDSGAEC